ncbi:MAG: restriction endonuclease subunit S [Bacteroidetes bacterium]|nr:restriction endonuclease subunit S [Bacteroidota bacterium]
MNWETVEIGQLGEVITGNTPPRKSPELYGDYIPFIKPTDMEIDRRYTPDPEERYSELGFEKFRKSLVPKGATCVVTIGSIGKKMTQAFTDCFINQAVNAVIPNENYDNDFIYYLLKNNLDKVKGLDSGTSSGRENVSKSAFSSIEVKVIKHLLTQRRIASILSAYDDLIENNLKRIKLLEEKAFMSYKLIVKSEKLEEFTIEELANVVMGQSPTSDTYTDEKDNLPFHQGVTNFTNYFVEHKIYCKAPIKIVEEGDILFSVRAPVGRINFTNDKICIGRGLCAFRSKKGFQNYFYHQLKEFFVTEDVIGNGAIFNAVTKVELMKVKLKTPSDKIQFEFEKDAQVIYNLIRNLTKQNTKLREARDILLPRLMSGEIDV